jgi:hypothetical protein
VRHSYDVCTKIPLTISLKNYLQVAYQHILLASVGAR